MAENVKCPVCGSPATLEESGWCFCENAECLCAWSAMCTNKIAAVTAQRDALKARVELLEAQQRADATAALYVGTERDALAAKLAALKKRVADAPKARAFVRQDRGLQVFPPPWKSRSTGEHVRVALVRLEDGE